MRVTPRYWSALPGRLLSLSACPFLSNPGTYYQPRLELVDGRLLVGGSLAGSRALAHVLLADYGPHLLTNLLPSSQLHQYVQEVGAEAPFPPLEVPSTPPSFTHGAGSSFFAVRSALQYGLYLVGGRRALGPDFVIRVGNNGYTPFLAYIHAFTTPLMSYYLTGIPDLVVEVIGAPYDRSDLRERLAWYQACRIPEIWEVEPATTTLYCHRRSPENEQYYTNTLSEGSLTPTCGAEWHVELSQLWSSEWGRPTSPMVASSPLPDTPSGFEGGVVYGSLPFRPRLALDPVPISFEEYIAWCPEAKFERITNRLSVASVEGTRQTFGLLAMTLGLRQLLNWLPPASWES